MNRKQLIGYIARCIIKDRLEGFDNDPTITVMEILDNFNIQLSGDFNRFVREVFREANREIQLYGYKLEKITRR